MERTEKIEGWKFIFLSQFVFVWGNEARRVREKKLFNEFKEKWKLTEILFIILAIASVVGFLRFWRNAGEKSLWVINEAEISAKDEEIFKIFGHILVVKFLIKKWFCFKKIEKEKSLKI
jgi:hypothetical protein